MQGAREIEEAKGTSQYERKLSQGEMINRENLSKSLVATGKIKSGTIIAKDHVAVKSPGQGLSPQKMNELIGKEIQRDMEPEDYFFPNDLLEEKQGRQARRQLLSHPCRSCGPSSDAPSIFYQHE